MSSRALSKSMRISFEATGIDRIRGFFRYLTNASATAIRQSESAADSSARRSRQDFIRTQNEHRRNISEINRANTLRLKHEMEDKHKKELGGIDTAPQLRKLTELTNNAADAKARSAAKTREVLAAERRLNEFMQSQPGTQLLETQRKLADIDRQRSAIKSKIVKDGNVQKLLSKQDEVEFFRATRQFDKAKVAQKELHGMLEDPQYRRAWQVYYQGRKRVEELSKAEIALTKALDPQIRKYNQLKQALKEAREAGDPLKGRADQASRELADFLGTKEGRAARDLQRRRMDLKRRQADEVRDFRRRQEIGTLPGHLTFDEEAHRKSLDALEFATTKELRTRAKSGDSLAHEELMRRRVMNTTFAMTKVLLAAVVAYSAYRAAANAASSVKLAASVEILTKSFGALMQNTQAAKDLVRELFALSTEIPIRSEQSLEAARVMLATGTPSNEIVRDLKVLAEISAGAAQPLNEIATIYGEIRTKNRMYREDVLQFSRRGIPIMQALSDVLKIERVELDNLISSGEIMFSTFRAGMESLVEPGGRFHGLLKDMASTTEGSAIRLGNSLTIASLALGEALLTGADAMFSFMGYQNNALTSAEKLKNEYGSLVEFLDRASVAIKNIAGTQQQLSAQQLLDSAEHMTGLLGSNTANTAQARQFLEEAILSRAKLPEIHTFEQLDPFLSRLETLARQVIGSEMTRESIAVGHTMLRRIQDKRQFNSDFRINATIDDFVRVLQNAVIRVESGEKTAGAAAVKSAQERARIAASAITAKTSGGVAKNVEQLAEQLFQEAHGIDFKDKRSATLALMAERVEEVFMSRVRMFGEEAAALGLTLRQLNESPEIGQWNEEYALARERLANARKNADKLDDRDEAKRQATEAEEISKKGKEFLDSLDPIKATMEKVAEIMATNATREMKEAAIAGLLAGQPDLDETPMQGFRGDARSYLSSIQDALSNKQEQQVSELKKLNDVFNKTKDVLNDILDEAKELPAETAKKLENLLRARAG